SKEFLNEDGMESTNQVVIGIPQSIRNNDHPLSEELENQIQLVKSNVHPKLHEAVDYFFFLKHSDMESIISHFHLTSQQKLKAWSKEQKKKYHPDKLLQNVPENRKTDSDFAKELFQLLASKMEEIDAHVSTFSFRVKNWYKKSIVSKFSVQSVVSTILAMGFLGGALLHFSKIHESKSMAPGYGLTVEDNFKIVPEKTQSLNKAENLGELNNCPMSPLANKLLEKTSCGVSFKQKKSRENSFVSENVQDKVTGSLKQNQIPEYTGPFDGRKNCFISPLVTDLSEKASCTLYTKNNALGPKTFALSKFNDVSLFLESHLSILHNISQELDAMKPEMIDEIISAFSGPLSEVANVNADRVTENLRNEEKKGIILNVISRSNANDLRKAWDLYKNPKIQKMIASNNMTR
ncbi:hypothetical protein ROZALSC1DRAFT_29198, partial [Rozella allomycis CSF55]